MKPTIALVINHANNRALIEDQLPDHYEKLFKDEDPLEHDPDLILIDWNGYQDHKKQIHDLVKRSKNNGQSLYLPVVLLARESEVSQARQTRQATVDEIIYTPVIPDVFCSRIDDLLNQRKLSLKMKDFNEKLQEQVQQKTEKIRSREEEIIVKLASASKHRDEETGGHIRRMGLYSEVMGDELGWDAERCRDNRLAAMMHDVGKVGIPDDILQKPGDLSDEQFETMKDHSVIGAEILGNSDIELLQLSVPIARHHHEQWDGSGYPDGLSEKQIPVEARLVAVIDVYDALVNDRVYRDAMPESKVLDIIREDTGSHFDPKMVECFFEVLPSIRAIRQLNPEELNNAIQS